MLHLIIASSALLLPKAPSQQQRVAAPTMQFGNPFEGVKNPFADKRDGATTTVLTVGFSCLERGPNSVLGQLDSLAAGADTSTAEGIAQLCSDTSLLLMRRSSEWVSCCGSSVHKGKDEDALTMFDRLSST